MVERKVREQEAVMKCDNCNHPRPDKGRACDGRRAYRCPQCGNTWTRGLQGRRQRYTWRLRDGNDFRKRDSGEAARVFGPDKET